MYSFFVILSLISLITNIIEFIKSGFEWNLMIEVSAASVFLISFSIELLNSIPQLQRFFQIYKSKKKQFEFNLHCTLKLNSTINSINLVDIDMDKIILSLKKERIFLKEERIDTYENKISCVVSSLATLDTDLSIIAESNKLILKFSNMKENGHNLSKIISRIGIITNQFKMICQIENEYYNLRLKYEKNGNPYLKYYVNNTSLITTVQINESIYLDNNIIEAHCESESKIEEFIKLYI